MTRELKLDRMEIRVFKVTVSHHIGQHLRDIELIPGRIGLPDIPEQ
jgi:hypothetical protein